MLESSVSVELLSIAFVVEVELDESDEDDEVESLGLSVALGSSKVGSGA